jgi:Tol biopolymer transport system component
MLGSRSGPRTTEVDQAFHRLETSSVFERSSGLLRLLRFLLEGSERDPDAMKEMHVGRAFYNRDETYDPRFDSIVRVNVRRLRQRLAEYYAGEGSDDPIRIEVPRGSYAPILTRTQTSAQVEPELVSAETENEDVKEEAAAPAVVAEASAAVPEVLLAPRRRLGLVAAAALVVVGSAVAILLAVRSRGSDPAFVTQVLQQVPLTMGSELEFEPATSPDGKRLAYVTRVPGAQQFQIFVRAFVADGKREQVLGTGPENALYPAWSPDGREIAFLRCGIGPCDVATVPVAGGAVHSVQELPTYTLPDDQGYYQYRQLQPIWAADGKGLIFPYRGPEDNAERLVLQDLASNRRRQLTFGSSSDEDAAPALAPDGRSVAFLRRHFNQTEVMTVDLATLKTRVLLQEQNAAAGGLSWSPDGRGVVVGMVRRAAAFPMWVPLKGSPKELDVKLPFVINPVFAADGKDLMVLSVNRSRNLAEVTGDASEPQPVFQSRQRNTATAFSPDTRQLAFLSDRSGTWEVWIAQRQGTHFVSPRQLTQGLGWYPSSVVWSPDGQTLAVGISNTNDIEMVDVHSGAINHLRLPGLEHSATWSPEWSSDGRWLYLTAWGDQHGIFRASATPVPAVEQVVKGTPREVRIDGDRALYFTPNYGRGIYRVSLTGDRRPEVVPQLRDVLPSRAWFIQDGALYYFDVHDTVRRLHRFDLTTEAIKDVSGPVPRIAFADGTLSYVAKDRLLIYSEWAEAAGSQIIALRWK